MGPATKKIMLGKVKAVEQEIKEARATLDRIEAWMMGFRNMLREEESEHKEDI